MYMVYKCGNVDCDIVNVPANDGGLLSCLPPHVAAAYPVDPKYAQSGKTCHIRKSATDIFDMLFTTYGNGELFSKMIYNSINNKYLEKCACYYSYFKSLRKQGHPCNDIALYPKKDGQYCTRFPPLGDSIRGLYDAGANSCNNHWGMSDNERHIREIQAVKCERTFAQDHTHEVVKNYQKKIGAFALWDVATETGEIACAVLVKSTKTTEFAHAAEQLARRTGFNPKATYSDTWPHKKEFWDCLFGAKMEGRLGLFHFLKRMTSTMRQNHVDHQCALFDLLECVYTYHEEDLDKLIKVLKNGTMSLQKTKYTSEDIADMQMNGVFRKRYSKYLRKIIRPENIIQLKLDAWFCKYKVEASEGAQAGQGRLDPQTGQTLFTSDAKTALKNCKLTCGVLQDPLAFELMYKVIPPNENSTHQLTQFVSLRGESKLESFHDNLAHFGNCGMSASLSDNLNLCGTARYNLTIRNRLRLIKKSKEERKKVPASWETVVSFTNHTQLLYINELAAEAGTTHVPFLSVELLSEDTGEQFFSQYLKDQTQRDNNKEDRCKCRLCGSNPLLLSHDSSAMAHNRQLQQQQEQQQQERENMMMQPVVVQPVVQTTTETQLQTPVHYLPVVPAQPQYPQYPPQYPQYPQYPQQYPQYPQYPPYLQSPWLGMQSYPQQQQQYYCCMPYFLYSTAKETPSGRPPHDTANCTRCSSR